MMLMIIIVIIMSNDVMPQSVMAEIAHCCVAGDQNQDDDYHFNYYEQ